MKIYKRIALIILISLILVSTFFTFFNDDRNCLEEIAKDYCQSKDLVYDRMYVAPSIFFCYLENDAHYSTQFVFTFEESDSCKKIKLSGDKV